MKRYRLALVLLMLVLCACGSAPSPTKAPTLRPTLAPTLEPTPTVKPKPDIRVIDGDTIEIIGGDTVRLLGIDTPEMSECGGKSARTALANLIRESKSVELVTDTVADLRDKYGRLLAYVEADGVDLGLELVKLGWADSFKYDSSTGYPYSRENIYHQNQSVDGNALVFCNTIPTPTKGTFVQPPILVVPIKPPATNNCHPSYTGACLLIGAGDYDCASGSGNGPNYTGKVQVIGWDEFGLDRDGDGWGCE